MKFLGTNFHLSKKYVKFLLFFLFIGIILGFLFYKKIDSSLFIQDIENIREGLVSAHINFIVQHFIVLAVLLFGSFMIFGVILFPLYFIWEIACITYSIFIFQSIFGVSGILFGIFYHIVIKAFFLFCLFILFKNVFEIIKVKLFHKEEHSKTFANQYKMILLSIFMIFIYDILLYFFGNDILLKLCFLIG